MSQRRSFIVPAKTLWPYISNGFREGFCLGIPQHELEGMKWFTPPNHASAVLERREIEATMTKEAVEGRLAGPFTREQVHEKFGFFRSNPMGSATNGDGSIRLINDWDDFGKVAKFFRDNPGEWQLAVFNWAKAYRQLPVHPCQRRFLCILDFYNRVWIDLAVGFGGVASCGVFGAPAHVWKIIIQILLNLRAIFCWVDDNLIWQRTTISPKNRDTRGLFVINTSWSFDDIESIVGKLGHTVNIVPHMAAYLHSFYRMLSEFESMTLIPNPDPQEVLWVGDASGFG